MFGKPKETKEDEKALLEIKCLSWFESTPALASFHNNRCNSPRSGSGGRRYLIRRADFDRVKVALESVGLFITN